MNKTRSAWLVAFAGLNVACAPAPKGQWTVADSLAVVDSIRAVTVAFAARMSALDVDGVGARFSTDPQLTFAADGNLLLLSHDALRDMYRGVYRGFRKMDFAWDTLRIAALSPVSGVVSGAGHFAVTDTGGTTLHQGVAVTYVFVQSAGKWQLLHGHASHRLLPDLPKAP